MSDLFWLTDEQIDRLRPFFPRVMGKARWTTGGCRVASYSSIAMGCAGEMPPATMARTRRCTTAGKGGVRPVCSRE